MIVRTLDLRKALDIYAAKLRVSVDVLNTKTFEYDYLSNDEQKLLGFIKDQLQPLFLLTKELEGNVEDRARVCKASHGKLQELLPVFEYILAHFEKLEVDAKVGKFNKHPGIQSSITLAWNKT